MQYEKMYAGNRATALGFPMSRFNVVLSRSLGNKYPWGTTVYHEPIKTIALGAIFFLSRTYWNFLFIVRHYIELMKLI